MVDWRPGGGSGLYTLGWPRPALDANLGFRPPAWVASTDRPPVNRALDSWEDPDEEEESPGTWPYGQRFRLRPGHLQPKILVLQQLSLRLGVVSYFQNCVRRVRERRSIMPRRGSLFIWKAVSELLRLAGDPDWRRCAQSSQAFSKGVRSFGSGCEAATRSGPFP